MEKSVLQVYLYVHSFLYPYFGEIQHGTEDLQSKFEAPVVLQITLITLRDNQRTSKIPLTLTLRQLL